MLQNHSSVTLLRQTKGHEYSIVGLTNRNYYNIAWEFCIIYRLRPALGFIYFAFPLKRRERGFNKYRLFFRKGGI